MTLLALLLVQVLAGICAGSHQDENCREVEMNPTVQNFFLKNHVFKKMEIESASACEVNCYMEADCISYNLKPLQGERYLCELSDSDLVIHPADKRYKKGAVYKSFKNRCSSNLCPGIQLCQTGFTNKRYRCVCASGLFGQNCDEEPPSVQVLPEIIDAEEGRDVFMMCNVTGHPPSHQVTWRKSQESLPLSRSKVRGGNLTIVNVSTQDSGTYVCIATNIWAAKSSSVQLQVYSALTFTIRPPSTEIVKANEALILPCSASSDLKPTIAWKFIGTPSLPQGAAIDASDNLIVSSANFTHDGTYSCVATNALNSIETNVIVYVKYPKTCSRVKANISDVSGDYVIDPDGFDGETPFLVYCNMTDKGGVGVTVVSHDSENRTHVTGFESSGSYSRDVDYITASVSQLKVLTEVSENCQQFIKYECWDSRIIRNGFAWWVSPDGEDLTYYDGADVTAQGCACGRNNSCADPAWPCNCDKNDQVWREDSGLLTNKSHLPVIQLRFGDTGGYWGLIEEGYHTLGELECYGTT